MRNSIILYAKIQKLILFCYTTFRLTELVIMTVTREKKSGRHKKKKNQNPTTLDINLFVRH